MVQPPTSQPIPQSYHQGSYNYKRHSFLLCGPLGVLDDDLLRNKPSFAELVQSRRFREISRIMKETASSSNPESIVGWLEPHYETNESPSIAVTSPLILLCHYHPTVTVLKAVLQRASMWNFDMDGCSVLHTAVRCGCSFGVIEAIVQHDSDIVAVSDCDGRLPLHYLMSCKWRRGKHRMMMIAQLLIQVMPRGVCTKDSFGMTPFDLAVLNRRVDRGLLEVMRLMMPRKKDTKDPASNVTETTLSNHEVVSEIPKHVLPCMEHDRDDISSVGSGGVSKHRLRRNIRVSL